MFEGFPDSPSWGYEYRPPPPEKPDWLAVLMFLALVVGAGLIVYNFFIGGFS